MALAQFSQWFSKFVETIPGATEQDDFLLHEIGKNWHGRIDDMKRAVLVRGAKQKKLSLFWLLMQWLKLRKKYSVTLKILYRCCTSIIGANSKQD